MLTRRKFLAATGSAGFLSAGAAQPATKLNFTMPEHACDCHTHIFGDPAQFPLFAGRTYTPEQALPAEMSRLHTTLHIERVVIVTPSVYGTDNACTLYGMKARGANVRGVCVVDEQTSAAELARLQGAGIRGLRLNLTTAGPNDISTARLRFQSAVGQAKSLGWHIQILTSLSVIAGIKDLVLSSGVTVVFDHFGGAKAGVGFDQPGFTDLLNLIRVGAAYVKISAPYRTSAPGPDYAEPAPLARTFIGTNADRVLWGSDWPHPDTATPAGRPPTSVTPLLPIDDGRVLNEFAVWVPDEGFRKRILVDNPARLYGF